MKPIVRGPYKIFFETLGNKARWEIVRLLRERPYRVSDIVKKLSYEQSLVSHHLKRLETCGFVRSTQNGRVRVYALERKEAVPLLHLIDKHVKKFCEKACCHETF